MTPMTSVDKAERPTNNGAEMEESRTQHSGQLMLGAARIRAEAEFANGQRPTAWEFTKAAELEQRVRDPLPDRHNEKGAGREMVPHGRDGIPPADFRDTIQKPDYVAAAASRNRLDLANEAGALEFAVDTADTIEAENSLEKMLAHQLAAVHQSSMRLTGQLNRQIERMNVICPDQHHAANAEAARTTNAIARLMQTFQQGVSTLQRLRSGGQQTVTVQHVTVGSGGQAVVAGAIGQAGGASEERGGR